MGPDMKINISEWIPGSLGGILLFIILFIIITHCVLLQGLGSHLINDQGRDNSKNNPVLLCIILKFDCSQYTEER